MRSITSAECQRNLKRQRKKDGLCWICGNQLDRKGVVCGDCRNRRREREAVEKAERDDCGLCRTIGCKNDRTVGTCYCVQCAEKSSSRSKRLKIERKAVGMCVRSGCNNDCRPNKTLCHACCKRDSDRSTKWKQAVLNHYGQVCNCKCGCRITKLAWLTIDHVNNDGAKRRKEKREHGATFYKHIVDSGFPDDIQILCWNCNCAKGVRGGCPE